MIRAATHDDVPGMVTLGLAMMAESPTFRRMRPDEMKLAHACRMSIDNGFAMVIEHGGEIVGGMLGMCVPHWASSDLVACDLALFVDQRFRGTTAPARLLRAFRDWGIGKGAALILFGASTGIDPERTAALAEVSGFRRHGITLEAIGDVS
jgi:GNAT superfamily N-acetyltransferase